MIGKMLGVGSESQSSDVSHGRSRRISQSEWPQIVARHENGESVNNIASEYGVTGPAIRYILKKAQGDSAKPATVPTEGYESPLAQRLAEASESCCQALDLLHKQQGDAEAVNAMVHQVRRALAAIEIELSRQQHASGYRSAEPRNGPQKQTGPVSERAGGLPASASREGAFEGTVKFFNHDKGFGFVTLDETSQDVFVHIRAVERSGLVTLEPEQRVRLTTTMGQKGPQAETVTLL